MAITKNPKKKPVVKKGIFLRSSSKGISVHIHAGNGNKLAVMTGYDTLAGAKKGINALIRALIGKEHGFTFIDERKQAAKKK